MDRTLQLVTLLSIIVGAALVVWELQQSRVQNRAQLTSEYAPIANAVHATVAGENLGAILAKACQHPDELTLEEGLILKSHYLSVINLVSRLALLSDRDGIYEREVWKRFLGYLNPIYDSYYGRAFLRRMSNSPAYLDGLIEAAIEDMERRGPPDCQTDHAEIIDAVRTEMERSSE